MICTAATAIWLGASLREAARFKRATGRVRDEQQRVLERLIRMNADTDFGRVHAFSRIHSVREYQQRVPVRTYEEFQPYIDRVCAGARDVLTRDPVRLFEPTSGTASPTKLIPYTASLQHEFQRGIAPWVADLFLHDPQLMHGEAYWSVSPAFQHERRTAGGIPIGFDDDAAYVGGWRRRLVQATMAVPPSARVARDLATFQQLTLLSLIRHPNLRLMSVWNPTFLSLLMNALEAHADALLHDLRSDPRRHDALNNALRARSPAERHTTLWPRLRLISCWADAHAAAPAAQVAELFPQCRIQPKGVIATEGFISMPMEGHEGSALAIRSHFLEFLPIRADHERCGEPPVLAHELESGQRYEVVLSNGAGLYRYRLGDYIEVVGRLHQCPLVRFIGRLRYISDWFGEKLNEAHVASVLRDAMQSLAVSPSFSMLACEAKDARPAYVLYIETGEGDGTLHRLGELVDAHLRGNVHYDYARRLGQLAPIRVFRAAGAGETYLNVAMRAGTRAGDVKLVALDRRDGWSQRFRGGWVGLEVTRTGLHHSVPTR